MGAESAEVHQVHETGLATSRGPRVEKLIAHKPSVCGLVITMLYRQDGKGRAIQLTHHARSARVVPDRVHCCAGEIE